jgi:hypothetical protein
MGIIKQAKNIKIISRNEYYVKAGNLVETANKMNIESVNDNLSLSSNKKIQVKGDQGVKYGDYSPAELIIEESEYKLESKFALEQLFEFAKKDSKAMFCFWMADIFGSDIPLSAYEQLYKDASDKKENINPKITVAVDVYGKGAAYNSNSKSKFKNHIIIAEGFINDAFKNNNDQKLLMIALVEEFGHHLDYLLRFQYSTIGKDAKGDEGAKYTAKANRKYRRYLIDPFTQKEQFYATASIKGEQKKLIWDFTDINQKLKEFVDNRTEKDDNYYAGYEFFSAGMGGHGEFGHQMIEKMALTDSGIFSKEITLQIYLGNWLRDYSQFVDAGVIRPLANALDAKSKEYKERNKGTVDKQTAIENIQKFMEENRVTVDSLRTIDIPIKIKSYLKAELEWESTTISPVKLSREAITSFVALLAVKEFGNKKTEENKPENYVEYLRKFKNRFFEINTETLGVYRPEEHIDNPAAYFPKEGMEKDLNYKLDPDYAKDPSLSQFVTDKKYGTKKYIRGNGEEPFPSAYDCFLKYINEALNGGAKRYLDFGAAMHILEDYYAHSNFCELAVIKVYDPEVYPWSNLPSTCKKNTLKKYTSDFRKNTHATLSPIQDRSTIKYNTISNKELQSKPFQNSGQSVEEYYRLPDTLHRRGLYYSHAECAAIQTGSFGKMDMMASITPKLNNKMLAIKVEVPEDIKDGERTFSDALALELLRDVSKAQANDTKEKNGNYKGINNDKYAQIYIDYLAIRDAYVKKRLGILSAKDVFSGFGILEFINAYLKVIQNYFYHELLVIIINQIDLIQIALNNQLEALKNGTWKIDDLGPTHTQIAKDNGMQPFHGLAILLATKAVTEIGRNMFQYWESIKNGSSGTQFKEEIKKLADEYFRHPMQTDWADEYVIDWCKSHDSAVKRAHTDSIILYGIFVSTQEIRKVYDDLYLLKERYKEVKTDTQNQEINHLYQAQAIKWQELNKKLFEIWKLPQFKNTYDPNYEKFSPNTTVQEAEKERQERLKK